jgi:hypothetical protein
VSNTSNLNTSKTYLIIMYGGKMRLYFHSLFAIVVTIALSSCAFKYSSLNNWWSKDWQPKISTSVIIIGSESPTNLWSVSREDSTFGSIGVGSTSRKSNPFEVLAIVLDGDGKIKLNKVRYLVGSDATRIYFKDYKFESLPELEILSPGIYYYGTFYVKNEKAIFQKGLDARVIEATNRRFPGLLDKMEKFF